MIREKRLDQGFLKIESKKLLFKLDEKLMPESYTIEQRYEAMFVVEEFMLLANRLVG